MTRFLPIRFHAALALALASFALPSTAQEVRSFYPDEDAPHEGTWLSWPHANTYGLFYRNMVEQTWVEMTAALVTSENVHIVVYDAGERTRVQNVLAQAGVPMTNVDFLIAPTDDTWIRDNGPIFVYGPGGELRATDWAFNGWGLDAPYALDDPIPATIANDIGVPVIDIPNLVLEGGAIEVDGSGTMMATRSSVFDPDRNPGVSEAEMEDALREHLGITNFIWLDGAPGGTFDITDSHIDGVVRFSGQTIVTMNAGGLSYYGLNAADISRIQNAKNAHGKPYDFVELPLTQFNVKMTDGFNLFERGTYVNFYAGNSVVLVPKFGDPNDAVARNILQQHYTDRTVISIEARNLFGWGGVVHCVTQQQPVANPAAGQVVGGGCLDYPIELETYGPTRIGATQTFGVHELPPSASFGMLLVGFDVTLPLEFLGAENCVLHSTGVVNRPMTVTPGNPDSFGLLAIPDDSTLVGVELDLQVAAFAVGTTTSGLVTSNGWELTLGE